MCAQSCDVKVKDFESSDDVDDLVRTSLLMNVCKCHLDKF
jgi:hypothetical protein